MSCRYLSKEKGEGSGEREAGKEKRGKRSGEREAEKEKRRNGC
jgi:hypothetical protein